MRVQAKMEKWHFPFAPLVNQRLLRVLKAVLGSRPVSNTFPEIQPFFIDALDSIQTFLLRMDWYSQERDFFAEVITLKEILTEIERIFDNEHIRNQGASHRINVTLANTCWAGALMIIYS